MRRLQADAPSQAVRNLVTNPELVAGSADKVVRTNLITNPSFETAGSLQTFRTNLATNPSFETAGPEITTRTNLAINPSMEAANGSVNVYTNLCPYPSMESAGGIGTVRTNLVPDPSFEIGSEGWINNGPGTTALDSAQAYVGTKSLKVVPGQENWGYQNPLAAGWISAGKTYTFSIYVYSDAAQTLCLTNYNTPTLGPSVNVPAGKWTRLYLTQAIPAGAGAVWISVRNPNRTTIPSTFYLDGYMIEETSELRPYFDPSNPITNSAYNPDLATDMANWLSGGTISRVQEDGKWWIVAPANNWTYAGATAKIGEYYAYSFLVKGAPGTTFASASTDNAVGGIDTYTTFTIPASGQLRAMVPSGSARAAGTGIYVGFTAPSSPIKLTEAYVERVSTPGRLPSMPYMKGQGVFTYTWSGAANASRSTQKATSVTGWGGQTTSTSYQATTESATGTKSLAILTNGNIGDGAYLVDLDVTAGQSYTISAWIKLTAAIPSLSGVLRFKDNNSTILGDSTATVHSNLVVGSWSRVSVTGVAPTGSTKLQVMWRTYDAHTPTTFYIDGQLITALPYDIPYFDGSSAATTDFTSAWAGTANESISYQQAPGVSNWTNRWFGSTGGSGVLYKSTSTGFSGACARKLWLTANTGAAMDTGINTPLIPVSEGVTYTAAAYVRCSVAQAWTVNIDWKDGAGARISVLTVNSSGTIPALQWYRATATGVAPTGAVNAVITFGPYSGAQPMPTGAYLEFDSVLFEKSPVAQPYFDGSAPISNLISNSSFETNTAGWYADLGLPTFSTSTDMSMYGGRSLKAISTTASADIAVFTQASLRPSTTYTLSWYVYSFAARNAFFDVTGVGFSQSVVGFKAIPATTWTRVSASFTTSANLSSALSTIYLHHPAGPAVAGQVIYIDGVLLEETSTLNSYYAGTGDYTYSWAGAANTTVSYQKATSVQSTDSVSTLGWAIQSSTLGNTGGSKAVRIIATSPSRDSFVELSPMFAGYTFKANTTYTMSADRTITAPLVNPSGDFIRVSVGSELTPTIVSGPPNTAGTSRMVARFTTGASTNLNFIRLYNGAAYGNGDVWWDKLVIEEGSTDGIYFDGTTPVYENIVKTVATALPNMVLTNNVDYLGQSWTRATASAGTSTSILRQYVNLSDLVNGATYTVGVTVANDQSTAQTIQVDFADTNGVSHTIQPGEVKRIKITGSKTIYDATFRFSDIEIYRSATESRSILYKDWLIEKGSTTGDYYAGTGDSEYSWSGTAHASSSVVKASGVAGMSTSSSYAVFQSTEWSTKQGTKSLRIKPMGTIFDTFSSVNGDTGALRLGMQAGKTYTAVAKVRLSAPLTGSLSPNRWARIVPFIKSPSVNNGNYVEYPSVAPTNAAGVYTAKTTFTLPSDATEAFIRLYNGAAGTGGDVWWDDFVLVEGAYSGDYFDGSSTAADGFTYQWTGTPSASTSTQRAMDVKGSWSGMRVNYYSSPTAPFAGSAKVVASVTELGYFPRLISSTFTPVRGQRYTVAAKMKSSGSPVQIALAWLGSSQPVAPVQSASNGKWVKVQASEICPPDANYLQIWIGTPDGAPLGTQFELDNLMLVADEYNGPFGSGDSYGWVWEGLPHASTSKGYPVGLTQLAGKPLTMKTTAGNYVITDIDPAKNPVIPANAPRTVYSVIDLLQDMPTGVLDGVISYGSDALNDVVPNTNFTLRLQSMAGPLSTLAARRTLGAGPIAQNIPTGRIVLIGGINENGYLYASYNNDPLTVDSSLVVAIPHERLLISADTVYHKHIATYIYPGVHSPAVRQEMIKLLAHEHDIPGM